MGKLKERFPGLNVSTTPIMAMGCRQCLPLSVVQLKGKHCRKPHCRNGVVDTFGPGQESQDGWKKVLNFFQRSRWLHLIKETFGNIAKTLAEILKVYVIHSITYECLSYIHMSV